MTDLSASSILLSARDLSIGYDQKVIAKGLNLAIHSGELICLLGPNGAGKSTLLKTLSGILTLREGSIMVGEHQAPLPPSVLARQLAIVLSSFEGIGGIKVEELIGLGRAPYLGWYGKLKAEDEAIIHRSMEDTATEDLKGRQVGTLSDGEKQRVMIARALTQETPLILLDEPTSHLDLNHRVQVIRLLHHLARKRGKGIVLSTHDLDLAIQGADRLWIVSDEGKLIQGYPEDLLFSGKISEIYGGDSQFDWMNGGLKLLEEGEIPVRLDMSVEEKIWVRRALARHGLRASNDPTVTAIVKKVADGWALENQEHTITSSSLGELLNHELIQNRP